LSATPVFDQRTQADTLLPDFLNVDAAAIRAAYLEAAREAARRLKD